VNFVYDFVIMMIISWRNTATKTKVINRFDNVDDGDDDDDILIYRAAGCWWFLLCRLSM